MNRRGFLGLVAAAAMSTAFNLPKLSFSLTDEIGKLYGVRIIESTSPYQEYFNTKLLAATIPLLVMDQFAKVKPFPPESGLSIRFPQ